MSNISFITTPKYIKSYNMMALLGEINHRRFDKKLFIEESHFGWKIKHPSPENWDYIWFHPDSPRKLAAKHPHDPWMCYVFLVFRQEIGSRTRGILSDEGVEDHWRPSPKKYPSWKAWLSLRVSHIKDEVSKQYVIDCENQFLPKGMEKY
jgi:hypothetical protein